MIEIDDKILSNELFEKKFVCDLQKCKGACCVEGDSGAPLTSEEVNSIGNHINLIKEEMSPSGLSAIENKDFYYVDEDGEQVTSLVNNKECVFVFRDQNNNLSNPLRISHHHTFQKFHHLSIQMPLANSAYLFCHQLSQYLVGIPEEVNHRDLRLE